MRTAMVLGLSQEGGDVDVLERLDHPAVVHQIEGILVMWRRKAQEEPKSSAARTLAAAEEILEDARTASADEARWLCRSLCQSYLGTHQKLELSPALAD